MITRLAEKLVCRRLALFPAVAIVGPRQVGKTTLAKTLGGAYFDLEQEADRLKLDVKWDDITSGAELVVLDEVQCWPEVMPRLRGVIDADRSRMGRFLLLGSVAPSLMVDVSESLAGRLSLVELTPLVLSELSNTTIDDLWLYGGFPDGGVLGAERYPVWHEAYLNLLVHRDLPTWGLPSKPVISDRLIRMTAAWHGQLWNASQMARNLGISHPTANSYVDFLAGAFLVRKLPSYTANLGKRLVKSPRLYWRDSGLLHSILGVKDLEDLLARPWVGASWEGFVLDQIVSTFAQLGRRCVAYFFRTSDGAEIDIVLEVGAELWAIEIKLTSNPSVQDLRKLERMGDLIGATRKVLISRTRSPEVGEGVMSCGLEWFLDWLVSQE